MDQEGERVFSLIIQSIPIRCSMHKRFVNTFMLIVYKVYTSVDNVKFPVSLYNQNARYLHSIIKNKHL